MSNAEDSNRAHSQVIDAHVHLFGACEERTGCFVSPRMRRHFAYQGIKTLLRIRGRDIATGDADDAIATRLVGLVEHSSVVDKAVLLALDGVFRRGGRAMDRAATALFVPNDYLFKVCEQSPALLPGASVHPERPGATTILREVIARGAAVLKWLPPAQHIDPSCRDYIPFYEVLAEHGVPLLCHTSVEKTFPTEAGTFEDPGLLQLPLEVGVRVIAAHCAASVLAMPRTDYVDRLCALMERFPNLFADNAALCSPSRGHHWDRLLRRPALVQRMVHGSDFPVPCWPIIYAKRLGLRRARELQRIPNALERDARTKQAIGVPESVFLRMNELIAHRATSGRV